MGSCRIGQAFHGAITKGWRKMERVVNLLLGVPDLFGLEREESVRR